jgi:agmatinase
MRHHAYEFSTPENFLGLDAAASDPATSRVVVLPIPYEATVSFGQGTREGPRAIIHASRQVELYDRWRGDEPALMLGIHTLPALAPSAAGPEATVMAIAACAAEQLAAGKHLVALGGEHTISVGIAQAIAQDHPGFVVVQIDAHADLRDDYEGSRFSHACAARRMLEQHRHG